MLSIAERIYFGITTCIAQHLLLLAPPLFLEMDASKDTKSLKAVPFKSLKNTKLCIWKV